MKSLKSKLDFYQKLLGLQDWRITLKENCKPDDLTIGSGHAGCSVFQEAEKVAVIEIVAPEHCGETVEPVDVERVLVHELMHLKFSLLCSTDDPDNDLQSRFVHQLIDDMARAIVARKNEVAVGECREEGGKDDVLRWIPTKEKLPPEGARVLACDDAGNCYTSLKYYGDDGWCWYADGESMIVNIVAWMPLPEPYKVVEEEKPKTRAEKFYEMFPCCAKTCDVKTGRHMPPCCWKDIVGDMRSCKWTPDECFDCWNKPYEGEFEEEEDER